MTALDLIRHAIGLIRRNFSAALHCSALPFLAAQGLEAIGLGLFGLVVFLSNAWVSVTWQRYVLIEEEPSGWMPHAHPVALGRYLLRYILVVIAAFGAPALVATPFLLVAGSTDRDDLFLIVMLVTLVMSVFLALRLCASLPAMALGRDYSLRDAFADTSRGTRTFATLALITLPLPLVLFLPQAFPAALALPVSLVVEWVNLMFWSSLMITFYGVYAEGRDLA